MLQGVLGWLPSGAPHKNRSVYNYTATKYQSTVDCTNGPTFLAALLYCSSGTACCTFRHNFRYGGGSSGCNASYALCMLQLPDWHKRVAVW
jgi:hypothetical protein